MRESTPYAFGLQLKDKKPTSPVRKTNYLRVFCLILMTSSQQIAKPKSPEVGATEIRLLECRLETDLDMKNWISAIRGQITEGETSKTVTPLVFGAPLDRAVGK